VEAAIENNSASVVSGATWNHKDITWSLAQSGGQFTGHMGAQEEQAIQKAFDQWSAATGLTFHEVSSSAKSDITIGWGDFDTAESGLVGLTGLFAKNGTINKATVRLENPSDDQLVGNANGQRIYANTDASFDQVMLHEIGHALGLGDNVDPSSIENYSLTQANRTLSANDIATVQSLYGKGSKHAVVAQAVDHGADGLVQAMSAFAPVPMANAVAANDHDHAAQFTYSEPMRHVR
jgi:predicted Zn-dependent protease